MKGQSPFKQKGEGAEPLQTKKAPQSLVGEDFCGVFLSDRENQRISTLTFLPLPVAAAFMTVRIALAILP